MKTKEQKLEQIKSFMRFIDNYNGELVIRFGEIYENEKLIATFKGNEVKLLN